MLQLVARCEGETLTFHLPEEEAVLGSSPSCDLVVDLRGVSRRHARVVPAPGGVRVVDCGSRNGIDLDGVHVPEVLLTPGHGVRLGFCTLSLEEVSSDDLALALAVDSGPARRKPGNRSDPDTVSADFGESPGAALLLIREIEELGPDGLATARRGILERARVLLGADTVALLVASDGSQGPHAVVGLAGRLLPEERLESLARSGARVPGAETGLDVVDGNLLVSGDEGRAILLAVFGAAAASRNGWKRDLFAYLARKFLPTVDVPTVAPPERHVTEELAIPPGMVLGKSAAVLRLLQQMRAAARSHVDVLLQGESGTGKELFARMIHASGPRPAGPFIAINCAAIPNELLEAELFGVQKGVATGVEARPGRFVQADGGTIFLDEIGDLAEPLQAKLLRVIQEREVLPLGALNPRKIDVRVISASNQDLLELTRQRRFRTDLYYRLRGVQYHLPPLRHRKEDIPDLVLAFLQRATRESDKRIAGISQKALALLVRHEWPGNVRELESDIRRAVLLCPEGGVIQTEHFAPIRWAVEQREAEEAALSAAEERVGAGGLVATGVVPLAPSDAEPQPEDLDLQKVRDAAEREAIVRALQVSRGNKSLAARLLKISRNGLAARMAALRIGERR